MAARIRFNLATRRLILGTAECSGCNRVHDTVPAGRKMIFPPKACDKCNGTGKRGNGRCRECKQYSDKYRIDKLPVGMVPDYKKPQDGGPCERCQGSGEQPAGMTDYLTAETMAEILAVCPVRVYRADRDLTWAEAYLGMVSTHGPHPLWTSEDYGRGREACEADPDAFLADITAKIVKDRPQACKVADRDGLVVDHIAVVVTRNGYTVRGVPATDAAAAVPEPVKA